MDTTAYVSIAQAYLEAQGIPENTAKSDQTEAELSAYIRRAMQKFFAFAASPKIAGFFFETEGTYGQQYPTYEKQPLAHASASFWLYKYYTDAVPANRSTVRKKSNNGENVSVLPEKMIAGEETIRIHAGNRGLCDFSNPKFMTSGEVTASGVLAFNTTQLLSVGQSLDINGIACVIATEENEGLEYTFTEASPVQVGPATVTYTLDTTGWQNWPRMGAASLLNF